MHWYGKIFPYDNAIHERNFLTITFGRWTLISKVTLELSPKISAKIWKLYAKQRNKKSLQISPTFPSRTGRRGKNDKFWGNIENVESNLINRTEPLKGEAYHKCFINFFSTSPGINSYIILTVTLSETTSSSGTRGLH